MAVVMSLVAVATSFSASGEPDKKDLSVHNRKGPAPAVSNLTASAELPVIMYLEKRGQTITVKAGPKGAVYSVKNAEGKALFENLSSEQLRARAPELHQFIKNAMAQNGGKSGAVLDARISVKR